MYRDNRPGNPNTAHVAQVMIFKPIARFQFKAVMAKLIKYMQIRPKHPRNTNVIINFFLTNKIIKVNIKIVNR